MKDYIYISKEIYIISVFIKKIENKIEIFHRWKWVDNIIIVNKYWQNKEMIDVLKNRNYFYKFILISRKNRFIKEAQHAYHKRLLWPNKFFKFWKMDQRKIIV